MVVKAESHLKGWDYQITSPLRCFNDPGDQKSHKYWIIRKSFLLKSQQPWASIAWYPNLAQIKAKNTTNIKWNSKISNYNRLKSQYISLITN